MSARRRDVALAGHRGDTPTAAAALTDDDAEVRALAVAALGRLDALDDAALAGALADSSALVRRRAVELSVNHPQVPILDLLDDPDVTVAEVAAWACGERGEQGRPVPIDHERCLSRLTELATTARDALVRESAVAALGAIGDERGLPAILAACSDKPAVRRRAVLALAPFDTPDVEAAIDAALADRDWQVRQAAEDLRRAADT